MTSAPAIGFEYTPSRWLPCACMVVAALATLSVVCCALALWIKLSLIVAIALGLWVAMRRTFTSSVAAIGLGADDSWTLRLRDGDDVPVTLASFRMLGALVLLRLITVEQGTQVVLLAPDNSDEDTRRRLRMRLAVMASTQASARA